MTAPALVVQIVSPPVAATHAALAAERNADALVSALARSGLLVTPTRASGASNGFSTGVSLRASTPFVTNTRPASGQLVGTSLLSTATLRLFASSLHQLFPTNGASATRLPIDYLQLSVELVRVVRDVASVLRSTVSAAGINQTEKRSSEANVATHIVASLPQQMIRVTYACRVLCRTLEREKAVLSERDASTFVQTGLDVAALLALCRPQRGDGDDTDQSKAEQALGSLWMVLGAFISQADAKALRSALGTTMSSPVVATSTGTSFGSPGSVAAVCLSVLRLFNSDSAWHCSGMSLFLQQVYLFESGRVVRALCASPLFVDQFENSTEVAAKLIVHRIARRPPISALSAVSKKSPTLTHGLLFIARCFISSVKIQASATTSAAVAALREAVKRMIDTLGEVASFFHWIAEATLCGSKPQGVTLDPSALHIRAQKSLFADAATVSALRPAQLQTLVALCLSQVERGQQPTLTTEALSVLFEAVVAECCQLHVQSFAEIRVPVHSVDIVALLRPVRERCASDMGFFETVLERVVQLSGKAYHLLLDASASGEKQQLQTRPRGLSDVYLSFGLFHSRSMWGFLLVHPLERLLPAVAFAVLSAMTFVLPLYSVSVRHVKQGIPQSKEALKLKASMEAAVAALASRITPAHCTSLMQEALRLTSKPGAPFQNVVYASRVETLLVLMRAPSYCAKLPLKTLIQDWSKVVLPCLSDSTIASVPSFLMAAAHDALIAPLLAKISPSILFVPTYVSMFCPVSGKSTRHLPVSNTLVALFASKVRRVAESMEQMDPVNWSRLTIATPGDDDSGVLANAASQATDGELAATLNELTPLSAILLVVQGVFDQVRMLHQRGPLTKEGDERRLGYLSALLNLLQCSNPLITSRVCACVEQVVLDLVADRPAEQERVLKFSGNIVAATVNFSMKKPLGEWLLRLAAEVRERRQKMQPKSKL